MAAPNKQPTGSRPGPKAVNQHSPNQAGMPKKGAENKAIPKQPRKIVTPKNGPRRDNPLH